MFVSSDYKLQKTDLVGKTEKVGMLNNRKLSSQNKEPGTTIFYVQC